MTRIYDECMRPTIAEVLKEHISHWPPSYTAALKQCKDAQGKFHFPSIELPPALLDKFNVHFRRRLNTIPSFQDSFYLHEWRGTKGRSIHDHDDPDQVDLALDNLFNAFDTSNLNDLSGWYVDVGLEISAPGLVVQWLTSRHGDIIRHALPHLSDERVTRLLRSRKFYTDISASLYALAGFRAEVHGPGKQAKMKYLNVYTTDKSPVYQLHYGAFRRHRAADLLPQKIGNLIKDIHSLGSVWDCCAGSSAGNHVQEGAARLEARVQMVDGIATSTFRDISRDLINRLVLGVDAYEWW